MAEKITTANTGLTGLALVRARKAQQEREGLSATAKTADTKTASFISDVAGAMDLPGLKPAVVGAEFVMKNLPTTPKSTTTGIRTPNIKKADGVSPQRAITDTFSPATNFRTSLEEGRFTNLSNPKPEIPRAPIVKPAVATTAPKVTTTGIRTPNIIPVAEVVDTTTNTTTTDELLATPFTAPRAKSKLTTANTGLTGKRLIDARKKAEGTAVGIPELENPEIFKTTESDLDLAKQREVTALREADVSALEADRDTTKATASETLGKFKNLIGLKEDGSIDEARPNSLAATNKAFVDNYKKEQNELSGKYESARKAQVVGNIRARLASRGIDISKIAPEQLIALSDEVGVAAFNDIYQNKEATLSRVSAKEEEAKNKLNELREKGFLADKEYANLITTVESTFNKSKNEIQRAYVNDIFGLTDAKIAKKTNAVKDAVNNVQAFLSGKVGGEFAAQFLKRYAPLVEAGSSLQDVYARIVKDPAYIAETRRFAEAQAQASAIEAQLKADKIQSEIAENQAQTNKALRPASTGGGSTASKATKFSASQQALLSEAAGVPITNVEEFSNFVRANPGKAESIKEVLKKAELTFIPK